ncbi:MAG: response regulator [Flavobacterium sp.]|nr:response regulator [Flavobacterium sp.]
MPTNYTFLLVDDNVIDQLVTSKLLKKILDIPEINIVNNGKEGIQWLTNFHNLIDKQLIILLDIRMPEMDGFEFLLEYEKLPEETKKRTQIYMLSSTLDHNDIQKAKNNKHVKKLLSKPFPIQKFKKIIT